jgi:hypothetical protein
MKTGYRTKKFLKEFARKISFPLLIMEMTLAIVVLEFMRVPEKVILTVGLFLILNLAAAMYTAFDLGIYLLAKKDCGNTTIIGGYIVFVSPLVGMAIPVAIGVLFMSCVFGYKVPSSMDTI